MTEPLAFLNGQLLPQSQAHLALNDAGFVFGATVTDLCRTFRHRLYRWHAHLARFQRYCAATSIDIRLDEHVISERAQELVEHNAKLIDAASDLALVMFATPGPIGYYLGEPTKIGEQPTFGMHTFPLPFARYRPWIAQGAVLVTPNVRAMPRECVDPHIKQRSRIHWWLAEREVQKTQPNSQALLLDLDGNVTETASANFLLVKNGELIAPLLENVLNGISLGVVTELCARLNIPIRHRNIVLDDCYAADEALLTSTGFCVAGVRQINDQPIAWPGPMLKRLYDAWSADVGIDIHGQILSLA